MSDLERLKYLAGVEVMSWSVDKVSKAICEGNGPLVVRFEGEIVRSYGWHCVPVVDGGSRGGTLGDLYIKDMLQRGKVIGHHERGTFDQCAHEPKFRVIQLPRPPGVKMP